MVVRYTELLDEGDLLSNDRFRLYFGAIPGGANVKTLSVLCDHVQLPQQSVGQIKIKLLGFPVAFVGKDSSDNTLEATFYEATDGRVLRGLWTWLRFCRRREDGTAPLKRDYARTCKLTVYDTTGRDALVFNLVNLFPTSIQSTDLQEQSGPAKHQIQFSVDEVVLEGAVAPTSAL